MRTAEEINQSILNDFTTVTEKTYRPGSAIGFYTNAVSRAMEDAYIEIENAKDPHIYTNLSGENLDKMGVFTNVSRETGESDATYLYRMMNWTYLKSGANLIAINDSLLNLEYSSNAEYHPGIYGAGTGIVYVIPNDYSDETIEKALAEAREKIRYVISPESYTEYIIPTPLPVVLLATIESENGDVDYLKSAISNTLKDYINKIAPNEYMSVGTMNNMALDIDNVDYFNINLMYINGESVTETKVLQNLETKLLFDQISWEG